MPYKAPIIASTKSPPSIGKPGGGGGGGGGNCPNDAETNITANTKNIFLIAVFNFI